MGCDVSFGYMKSELSKVLSLPIPHEDKELILYRNIMNLTGFDPAGLEKR
ncbi:MAG TPA: hypothetical protein PLW88_04755 [Syntrophorhabdaceae bacterium]|nr:hypothetical protein [Syntrophorhabdaceae bacterium]